MEKMGWILLVIGIMGMVSQPMIKIGWYNHIITISLITLCLGAGAAMLVIEQVVDQRTP